ncbi:MAG TPA: hypothetical protein VGK33_03655 [Chloroflexota bacterium]
MVNDSTRLIRRTRRAWPPTTARTAAAIIVTASLALPVAAVGSSQSTNTQKALAYSRCMRSHGVPNFPDPTSSGAIPKVSLAQLGVSSSEFQAAEKACRSLLPTGESLQQQADCLMMGNCPAAEVRQMLAADLKYARCMRSHGLSNWPDPTFNPQGMPVFNTTAAGISHRFIHSPRFRTLNSECQRLTGGAPVARE